MIEMSRDGSMYQMMYGKPVNVSSLIDAAEKTCRLLGISPNAWQESCQAMGSGMASLAVASIEAKGQKVRSPKRVSAGYDPKSTIGRIATQ